MVRINTEQQRIQDGMAHFNFVSKAEILNLIDVKKGVQIFENKTLRKQNIVHESIQNIKMKKHISEKMFKMYQDEIKRVEKFGNIRRKNQMVKASTKGKRMM